MKIKILPLLFLLAACASTKPRSAAPAAPSTVVEGKLFASLFQQRAAEYRALCFQAYNTARMRLDQQLPGTGQLPLAVITDIDETVLDNSAYEVHQTLQGKDYDSPSWNEWTAKGAADTVPGAPSFFKYAASKGVEVFYITNRDEKERAGTLLNLQKFQLPFADQQHLVMRQSVSSKESRRMEIMNRYQVILLIGDNLADFSSLFDKKPEDERNRNTAQMAQAFGNRFIILPNPVYGDWESALYQYKSGLTLAQKDSIIRASVKGY